MDDGRQIYDVEFYTTNYKEYDYEIDARTGNVLSFDYDAEYYQPSNNTGNGTVIGEAKAKSIALARVPGRHRIQHPQDQAGPGRRPHGIRSRDRL